MSAINLSTIVCVTVGLVGGAGCGENLTPAVEHELDPVFECVPNLDGQITAAELPVVFDLDQDYFLSPEGQTQQIDSVGSVNAAGRRVWDWSSEEPADTVAAVGPTRLLSQWFATSFPGGDFVIDAGTDGTTLGIYSQDDSGVWLHGLASSEMSPPGGRTLLVYTAPVPVLRLPLAVGQSHTATGEIVGGTLNGLPYVGTDSYEIAATDAGTLALPYVSFTQALRVTTRVTTTPAAGGVTVSRRQVGFYFECFGEIASASSQDNESDPAFQTAARVRRFAL